MSTQVTRIAIVVAWLGLVVLWFSTIWWLHNPFPFSDDYNSCVAFLTEWLERGDLTLLLRTYNEAPTLLLKATVIGSYYLFGTVSFAFLAMFAAIAPVAFSLCLACWVSRTRETKLIDGLLLTLPALILMTQPATWGGYLWATSAYVHGFLPLMALIAFMAFERGALARGVAVAVLAAFVGGAGIFITALACAHLVFRWRRAPLVWVVLGIAALGIVLRIESITSNSLLHADLSTFLKHERTLQGISLYTLAFVGNAFDSSNPMIAAVLGATVLGVTAILSLRCRGAVLAVIVLALCAGLSSAILRFPEGGLQHSLLSRYQVYSTAAWSALYALMIVALPRIRVTVWALSLIVAGVVAYRSYASVPATVIPFNLKAARELVAARFDPSIVIAEFPPRAATDEVLRKAAAHGIFNPDPTPFFVQRLEHNVDLPTTSAELAVQLLHYQRDDRFIYARGRMAIEAEQQVSPRSMCLVAISRNGGATNVRLCLPAVRGRDLQSTTAPPLADTTTDKALEFALLLPIGSLPNDGYDIALMALGKRSWHVQRLSSDKEVPER